MSGALPPESFRKTKAWSGQAALSQPAVCMAAPLKPVAKVFEGWMTVEGRLCEFDQQATVASGPGREAANAVPSVRILNETNDDCKLVSNPDAWRIGRWLRFDTFLLPPRSDKKLLAWLSCDSRLRTNKEPHAHMLTTKTGKVWRYSHD